ncbi:zinc finger protein CONSTANS-LIKE 9 [Solanum dulcamara]|uniref:zinc finger protein CONSTANS-LIKE 9 n=1 Tax=Solanum dulcamara TaxID=45834 RepID=UPI002484E6B8|nr:zinc finger protein CONSTANS-LIKE 9 [Solanum dulcamara]
MAFTPHDHEYYSHGVFSNEFINSSLVANNPPLPQICPSSLYDHNINEQLFNINSLSHDHYVPPSISMMPWFPERLGVSDMTVPVLLPASSNSSDYSLNTTTHQVYAVDNNNNNNNNNGCNGQHHDGCESWDENTDHGFESTLWSPCPLATSNNWGAQRETSPKINETPAMKIGRYSEEERKDRILRYLKKRNQRNFNKTIKYACRKTLADKRVRVRGRFAKNNEACDDEVLMKGNVRDKDVCCDNPLIQMKHGDHYNEEGWLEEAITNLMYIPYIGSSYDGSFMS